MFEFEGSTSWGLRDIGCNLLLECSDMAKTVFEDNILDKLGDLLDSHIPDKGREGRWGNRDLLDKDKNSLGGQYSRDSSFVEEQMD